MTKDYSLPVKPPALQNAHPRLRGGGVYPDCIGIALQTALDPSAGSGHAQYISPVIVSLSNYVRLASNHPVSGTG